MPTVEWVEKEYTYSEDAPHAVTALTDAETSATLGLYEYDANGNMTCRIENNVTYKQVYNTENRISSIQKLHSGNCGDANPPLDAKWDFAYDGDGTRTATLTTPYDSSGLPQTPTLTAYYFGGAYEVTGDTIRKYYSFAGQTIAMRTCTGGTCSAPTYFLTDHLGSVVAITDASGTLTSQQRYLPFGETRANVTTPGDPATDYGYTGQRLLDDAPSTGSGHRMGGLMDYKARFYSSYINHFIQPDSLIPDPSNPQAWNRYAYVLNNPVRYNDPDGHDPNPCLASTCPSFVSISFGIDIPTIMMVAGLAIAKISPQTGGTIALAGVVIEGAALKGHPVALLIKSTSLGAVANVDAYGNLAVGPQASIGKSLTPIIGASITTGHILNRDNLGSNDPKDFPTEGQTKSSIAGPTISGVTGFPPGLSAVSPIPSGFQWSPTAEKTKIIKMGYVIGTTLGSVDFSWTFNTKIKLWKSKSPWGNNGADKWKKCGKD